MREYFCLSINIVAEPTEVRNLYHNNSTSISDLIYTYDDLACWLKQYPNAMIRNRYSNGVIYENISFCAKFGWSTNVEIFINDNQFIVKNEVGNIR